MFRNYFLLPDSGEKTAGICPEIASYVTIETASSHTVNNVSSWKSRRSSPKLRRPQTCSFFFYRPMMSASHLCCKEQCLKQRQSQPRTFFLRFLEAHWFIHWWNSLWKLLSMKNMISMSCEKHCFPIFRTTKHKIKSVCLLIPSSHLLLIIHQYNEFWAYSVQWDHIHHSCSILIEPETNVQNLTLR